MDAAMERRDGNGSAGWRAAAAAIVWIASIGANAIAQEPRFDQGAVQVARAIEAEIRDARLRDVPAFAPAAFARADEAYRALVREISAGMTEANARARAETIRRDLGNAS